MRGTVGGGAFVIPALDGKARQIRRFGRIKRDVEAQENSILHRGKLARQRTRRAGVTHSPQATDAFGRRSPDLKTGHVKLAVDRINRAVQRAEFEIAQKADDGSLRTRSTLIQKDEEKFGPIVSNVNP